LTKYNFPGFVLTAGYIVGILVICLVPNNLFNPHGHISNVQGGQTRRTVSNSPSYPYLMQLEQGASEIKELPTTNGPKRTFSFKSLMKVPGIVVVFLLLNFTVRAVLATLETLSTYIISYLYTESSDPAVWQKQGAPEVVSETFTIIGIVGLATFVGVYFMSKYVQDRITLITGLLAITAGLAAVLDFNDGKGVEREISLLRYEIGLGFAWAVGYPLCQTVVVSALSKVLTSEQQGVWMGNLASAGSAGRIIAPTIGGIMYNAWDSHTGLIPLSICFGLSALSVLLVAITWKRLKPEDQ